MREDELDRLLGEAVASYGDSKLPQGMENRILQRAAAGERARSWGLRWWWAAVIPMAACLLLVISLHKRPEQHAGPVAANPAQGAAAAQPVELGRVTPKPPTRKAVIRRAVVATTVPALRALPRKDQFPAAGGLSQEERTLVMLARQPADVRQQVMNAAAPQDRPIQISAIQIEPLSVPDEGRK